MHSLHHFPLVQNRTIHSVLVLYNCTDSILWQLSYNLYCVQLVNSMEWGHSSSLHKDKSTKTHPHTHLSSVYDALCCRATQFVLNWNEWLFCCPSVYEGALFILYSKQRLHTLDGLVVWTTFVLGGWRTEEDDVQINEIYSLCHSVSLQTLFKNNIERYYNVKHSLPTDRLGRA